MTIVQNRDTPQQTKKRLTIDILKVSIHGTNIVHILRHHQKNKMKTIKIVTIEIFNNLEESIQAFITTRELDYQRIPIRSGKRFPQKRR